MEKDKVKISIVRGAFLNPFELQNFYPLAKKYDLRAISSMHPISEDITIPLTKTYAVTDLPDIPFKYPLLNRLSVDAHYLMGLEQILKSIDIAHVAETYYHYTIQAVNAKKKGYVKKVVSSVWEIIPFNNEGIWGRKWFKRQAYKGVDHFLAVTELARKALLEEGVSEKKITVIPMGVDLARFKPVPTKSRILGKAGTNLKSQISNILCVGRLVPEKGMGELAEAFRGLREKYPDLKLTLVGDGPLKNYFGQIPGITIKRVPYQQIHEEYHKADIFCLPSKTTPYWQEQYGMALVEAMACGLPIATTRTGAIGEVCADAAVYAKPGDANDLQLKLARLIESESSRILLREKSIARAKERYDSRKTAKQIDALYQKVLWE